MCYHLRMRTLLDVQVRHSSCSYLECRTASAQSDKLIVGIFSLPIVQPRVDCARRSTGDKDRIIVNYTVNVSNECLFNIVVGYASILHSLGHGFLGHIRIIEIVAFARFLELECSADRQ